MNELREALQDTRNARALEEYKISECLGSGGFAKVYLATSTVTSQKVAIKVYWKDDEKSSKHRLESVRKEVDMIKSIKHPNVVNFYGYTETPTHVFIFLEYCNGGDVWQFLDKLEAAYSKNTLDHKTIAKLVRRLVRAVSHLHDKRMIHRDIKPENVLIIVDDNMNPVDIKLADLGLCAQLDNPFITKLTHRCGTQIYMPPELYRRQKYSEVQSR